MISLCHEYIVMNIISLLALPIALSVWRFQPTNTTRQMFVISYDAVVLYISLDLSALTTHTQGE